MNKKFIWIIVILLIAVVIFSKFFSNDKPKEEFKPIDKNIGDEFTELSYPNKMYIINYEIADVTGDSESDMVLLIGEHDGNSDWSNSIINNLDVVIYDTAQKSFIKADSKKLYGKNNRIMINDYTGDQVLDIMIMNEIDNGVNLRIYTYEKEKLKEIWKDRNNKGLVFSGEFLDGFKVKLINKKLNIDKELNLSNLSEKYIQSKIYNNSGKLCAENNKITTSGFIVTEIVKLNDRGGIRTIQRIYGIDENDIIDEIQITWKYYDGKWQMVEASGLKLGNLLF